MVINIEDGGSLSFYKVFRATSGWNRRGSFHATTSINDNNNNNNNNNGQIHESLLNPTTTNTTTNNENRSSMSLEQYDNQSSSRSERDAATTSSLLQEKQSIFLRKAKSRRDVMEMDEETKAKIDKVSIYVSSSTFREPMEMPYLYIPGVSCFFVFV